MKWLRKLVPFKEFNSGEQIVQKTQLRIDATDKIRQIIRQELFRQTINSEAESFDAANDFEFDDGEEWVSPYENEFEPEPKPEPGGGQSPPQTDPPPADPGATNGPPPQPQPATPPPAAPPNASA